MSSYATLSQFLDYENKDLARLFNAIAYNLSPKITGLTLLVPSDSFIKDMSKLIEEDPAMLKKYKDSVDSVLKSTAVPGKTPGATTVRMFLKSLLINGSYREPSDFPSTIDNHIRRSFTVKKINKDSVELDIGTLKKHPKFKAMESWRDIPKISVWILDGTPSVTTAEKKFVVEKKGGGQYDFQKFNGNTDELKVAIWDKVLTARIDNPEKHIELVFATGLLNYLEEKNQQTYEKVLTCMDPSPASTIFILINVIDKEYLADWVGGGFIDFELNALTDYVRHYEKAVASASTKELFKINRDRRNIMNIHIKDGLDIGSDKARKEYNLVYKDLGTLHLNLDYTRMLIHEFFYATDDKSTSLNRLRDFTLDLFDTIALVPMDIFKVPEEKSEALQINTLLSGESLPLAGFLLSSDYLFLPSLKKDKNDNLEFDDIGLNATKGIFLTPYTAIRYVSFLKLSLSPPIPNKRKLITLTKKLFKGLESNNIDWSTILTPAQLAQVSRRTM